ncbi:fatty acyl-CoA reductase wat [Bemisia tabaci]|uniref:fatty acyl-CoA reductase wat n=1 Tax=Bemisia tabaci TaxID=7038 RepID=UPI003B287AAC
MTEVAKYKDELLTDELMSKAHFYDINAEESEIQKFYNGQTVFITGGTGFLGKIIIEKLLRVTKVKQIYLLVRPKKNVRPQKRLEHMLDDPVFERLKQHSLKSLDKMDVLEGDLEEADLGLSDKDKKKIVDEVTIVFHSAATVRFNENLKIATRINVCGTKETLALGHHIKNLQAFVYVSTAFSHCPQKEIGEQFYQSPVDVDQLLTLKDVLNEEQLDTLTPLLLNEWPNTYVFTKAAAEEVVRKGAPGLPLSVVRPAIITTTYNEPLPGWIDNLYGPGGIVVGAAAGVLRTIHCDEGVQAEIVPGDMAGNCILAAAWDVAKRYSADPTLRDLERMRSSSDVPVYNFCLRPGTISWGKMTQLLFHFGFQNPPYRALMSCDLTLNSSKLAHRIYMILFHYFPAYTIDLITGFFGKSKGLVKMYQKIEVFTWLLGYFAARSFNFSSDNVRSLYHDKLSQRDKELFNFDLSSIDWSEYMRIYYLGTRKYLMKDDPSTIPAARVKYNRLHIMNQTIKVCMSLVPFLILYFVIYAVFL